VARQVLLTQMTHEGNLSPGIPLFPNKIEAKCQRLFDDGHTNGTNGNTAKCNAKWKIQDGGL